MTSREQDSGMRLTKIYTKVGDGGSTLLANGARIAKDAPRIEAYGTVDELNSFLGLWRDSLRETDATMFSGLLEQLLTIQNEMMDLGGELATPPQALDTQRQAVVNEASIKRLEQELDFYNERLPPLANFVLPGGHRVNALAHVCRTICRRAERRVVTLSQEEAIRAEARIYLNRLSDWLFVAGRECMRLLALPEVLWSQKRGSRG